MRTLRNTSFVFLAVLIISVGLTSVVKAQIGFNAIEPALGFVSPEGGIGSTFMLAVNADLGNFTEQIKFEGTVDFWKKTYDETFFGSNYEWSYTNFGFIGCARYDFPSETSVQPFGFAGLGLHIAKTSGESSYRDPFTGETRTEDVSDSSMEFGFRIGGGAEFEMGESAKFVGRAGFDANGGSDYFFISGGVKFPLGG